MPFAIDGKFFDELLPRLCARCFNVDILDTFGVVSRAVARVKQSDATTCSNCVLGTLVPRPKPVSASAKSSGGGEDAMIGTNWDAKLDSPFLVGSEEGEATCFNDAS